MKRVLISGIAAGALVAGSLSGLSASAVADAAPAYTVQSLHFAVKVGPNKKTCDIVGDLYVPADASSDNRYPAILTTNGFGGSKDDQAGMGKYGASHGYVVLSYSGLGFGGSTCQITLDDPDWDGQAGSQLVSFLGGAPGIAFTDAAHTDAVPALEVVTQDARAHDGTVQEFDPRVGMVGGSYGGQVQFAVASVDPRLDTIVPMITWSDLSYSLAPNNANPAGTTVTSTTPGVAKLFWALGFTAIGVVDGLTGLSNDPSRILPCPNFASWVCPGLLVAATTGAAGATTVANLQHASVASYLPKIKIPVLLAQGEFDTLFNLNEAAATYHALKAQGTPVKMIWHSWGHSASAAQPGEFDTSSPDPANQYETGRVFDWFAHYLKDEQVSTGPAFAYFRDWVNYTGNAEPAFGTAEEFGAFPNQRYYLGSSSLSAAADGGTGTQMFLTPPLGLPTSMNPIDALGSMVPLPQPEADLPGTFASWSTPALTSDLDVVGSPVLHLKVSAPLSSLLAVAGTPLTDLVLFVRVRDVAPDGTASDIRQLTAPIRVNPANPFTVRMPAIVHQFAKGHKIELVVAGGSVNYRGGLSGNLVSIAGGATQTLDLPTPQLPEEPTPVVTEPTEPTVPVTTPVAPPVQQAPSAPTKVRAQASGTTVALAWAPPASSGSAPIVGYQATCAKSSTKSAAKTTTAGSVTFKGFANGKHRCTVKAISAAGASAAATITVKTKVRPTAPQAIHIKVSRTKHGRTVRLRWKAAKGYGDKVTYVVTSPHHRTVRTKAKSIVLYGVPKGRSVFTVKAKTKAGKSAGAKAVAIFRS